MNHQTSPCVLSLADIDPHHSWSLHQDLDLVPDEEFLARVRLYGMLRPPLVRRRASAGYQLISGSLRLKALEMLGIPETTCLLLPASLDNRQILHLVARDQAETGSLSPIEAARLVLLARNLDLVDQELLRNITGVANHAQCMRLPQILQLEPFLLALVHRGVISARIGFLLGSLSAEDRLFLGKLFQELELNDNKQMRVIEWGRIITTTESISFRELFAERYGFCVNPEEAVNRPQIIHRLLQDLQKHSSPRLVLAQQAFDDRVAGLHLPQSCRVTPSKSFESDRVTLSVELASLTELETLWPSLQSLLEK